MKPSIIFKKKTPSVSGTNIKQRKFRMKFLSMLILMALLPLLLGTVILGAYSLISLRSSLQTNAEDTLYVVASNLASHCENENISYSTADKFNDYIDSLKERDIEMTILIKGAPSVSSIKNENGYRIRDIVVRDEVYVNPDLNTKGVYISNFVVDGNAYFTYFKPLEVNGEMLGVVMSAMPQALIDEQISSSARTVVIFSVILVVVLSVILLIATRDIMDTMSVLDNNMNNLADGNLGNTRDKNSKVVEFHNLVTASKSMNEKLEAIISDVQEATDNLANNVKEVTELSEHNSDRADNIAEAMRELSDSTTDMADYVSGITHQMIDMGDSITNISDSVEQLSDKSGTLMSANDDARNNIEQILESNKQAFVAVSDIASQIKETNESIANINAAVDIILGIANKTKLLSLNASIEAARAGEAGRGFAVVADEIRQLSEQSSTGAESIRKIAQTIVDESARSVELADEVYGLMNNEKESVVMAGESYRELAKNIRESADEIEQIARKTESLTEAKAIVLSNVEKLSALSEQNAAGNQSVSSDVEIITTGAKAIFEDCDAMNQLAQNLKDSIAYFNI